MAPRVLVVDPICRPGHTSFNSTCIRDLVSEGFEVTFVGAKGYLPSEAVARCSETRAFRFKMIRGKALSRVVMLANMADVRALVESRIYSAVLFTDFDEVTFFVSRLSSGNVYCVCHGTVVHLRNPLKRASAKRVFARATAVAFNEHIRQGLQTFGVSRIVVSPHGLPAPFAGPSNQTGPPPLRAERERLIFVPSVREADPNFLEGLLGSRKFARFLEDNNVALLTRGRGSRIATSRVRVVPGPLSSDDYATTFLGADLILLPYSRALQHRVSNVLFECFANRKPVVILESEAMAQFRAHFEYAPFVSSEDDLIGFLSRFFVGAEVYKFKDLKRLEARYEFLR